MHIGNLIARSIVWEGSLSLLVLSLFFFQFWLISCAPYSVVREKKRGDLDSLGGLDGLDGDDGIGN